MHTRLSMRRAMLAAAFSVLAALPAAAADECKGTVVSEGKPAAMRDLGAYPNSLFSWRAAVKDKYGSEYNSWRYAKDAKVDCVEKGGQWVCTRSAKPCLDMLHRAMGTAKEAVKKKDCKGDSLSSYGARKKDKKAALEQAEIGWEIDVRKKYGKEWAEWDNAADTDIDCHDVGGGIQCIAVGTACKP